jgi:hypothetical protein
VAFARASRHRVGAGAGVAQHRVGPLLGLGELLLALGAGVGQHPVAVGLRAADQLVGLLLGLVDVPVGGLGRQGQHPGGAHAVVLAGLLHRRRGRSGGDGLGRPLLGAGRAATVAAELVVLLDQASELGLDHVEEGVDLVLVVATLADRRLLEDDVVHVGGREWHRGHLGSDGRNRAQSPRAARGRDRRTGPRTELVTRTQPVNRRCRAG